MSSIDSDVESNEGEDKSDEHPIPSPRLPSNRLPIDESDYKNAFSRDFGYTLPKVESIRLEPFTLPKPPTPLDYNPFKFVKSNSLSLID